MARRQFFIVVPACGRARAFRGGARGESPLFTGFLEDFCRGGSCKRVPYLLIRRFSHEYLRLNLLGLLDGHCFGAHGGENLEYLGAYPTVRKIIHLAGCKVPNNHIDGL